MIYTCYEMIVDCRSDRPRGWCYFITSYVPVIRKILAHYGTTDQSTLERVLVSLRQPESSLFQSLEPAPERWFIAQLRQNVLQDLPELVPAVELDLETLGGALEPLTLVEKQVVWLEGMLYSAAETGVLLRMAPPTAEKIRAKAAELVRGKTDSWSQSLLTDNGRTLGRLAAAAGGPDCLPPKPFLDMLDGRTTWQGREQLERHVIRCWYCIDHFCRLVEVVELLRANKPLTEVEAEPFQKLLGVQAEKRAGWKRWFSGA